jgi:glucose-1-phosphate cytidylyltransferase
MKAVILAGGLGTRLSEETHLRPKPMIEIGGKPMLWHLMKIYSAQGINEFIVCAGYKGFIIKEYFANYFLHNSDATFDLLNNKLTIHHSNAEPWHVTVVDTGEQTMTGGRLRRVKKFLANETFCFTYGDGLSDVKIQETINFHKKHGGKATITAVQPPGRFGILEINTQDMVNSFLEKPQGQGTWINGGFFVLEPSVIDLIADDTVVWEKQPLEDLAAQKQLHAYKHEGFWQCMDTVRDKLLLESLWESGSAPWKSWK